MTDLFRVYTLRDHPPDQPDGWFGEVEPWLFVGGQPYFDDVYAAKRTSIRHRLERLTELGITHILNVADDVPIPPWVQMELAERGRGWHHDPVADTGAIPPDQWFADGVRYASEVRVAGGRLYVHCAMGSARAPSMAYAILRFHGTSRREARQMVMEARPYASAFYIPDAEAWFSRRYGRR